MSSQILQTKAAIDQEHQEAIRPLSKVATTVAACPEMPQALAAKAEGAERCLRLAVEGTEIFCPSKRMPQIGGENHGRWPFLW